MKYSEGTRVKIIKNISGHCWPIGFIVTITDVNETCYRGNHTPGGWFVDEECVLGTTLQGNMFVGDCL